MHTSLTFARACGLLSFLVLAACSIVLDTDRHRSDAVPVAATEFCTQLADIACTGLRDCCPQPALDFEMCLRTADSDCIVEFGRLGLDARTGYDPGQAGLALAEARRLVDACDPGIETWSSSPLGFRRTLAGSIPLGEPCDPNIILDVPNLFQCEDDGLCRQMGTAADPDWRCTAPAPIDGECTFDAACEPGLRCTAVIEYFTTGTCQPWKDVGEPCARASECATWVCDTTCREATNGEAYCGDEVP